MLAKFVCQAKAAEGREGGGEEEGALVGILKGDMRGEREEKGKGERASLR